jgi:hypothetical protein
MAEKEQPITATSASRESIGERLRELFGAPSLTQGHTRRRGDSSPTQGRAKYYTIRLTAELEQAIRGRKFDLARCDPSALSGRPDGVSPIAWLLSDAYREAVESAFADSFVIRDLVARGMAHVFRWPGMGGGCPLIKSAPVTGDVTRAVRVKVTDVFDTCIKSFAQELGVSNPETIRVLMRVGRERLCRRSTGVDA